VRDVTDLEGIYTPAPDMDDVRDMIDDL
jgi:hypothetical protein